MIESAKVSEERYKERRSAQLAADRLLSVNAVKASRPLICNFIGTATKGRSEEADGTTSIC